MTRRTILQRSTRPSCMATRYGADILSSTMKPAFLCSPAAKSRSISGEHVPAIPSAYSTAHAHHRVGSYFQNVWPWVGAHDVNNSTTEESRLGRPRIAGRIHGAHLAWLCGMASEHAVMSQHPFSWARTISTGVIQTETCYF